MVLADLPLLDFIPALSPHLNRPDHLADWCSQIERTLTETVRATNSKPTRLGKTWTTLHGIVWLLLRRPTWRILLITHEHRRAEWLGEQARMLYRRAGGTKVMGQDTKTNWSTPDGGGLQVLGAGQSGLGSDSAVVIADDPIDENGMKDPLKRGEIDEMIAFYTSRAIVFEEKRQGSVLLIMSRGDLDDPVARRIARGWENVTSSAIEDEYGPNERGNHVLPLSELKKIRDEMAQEDPSLRRWRSQWQNDPLANAEGFFEGEIPFVGSIPPRAPRVIGVDISFTQGKKSDYCAFVEMVDMGHLLVVDRVQRHRRGLSYAIETLEALRAQYPEARFVTYSSGQEVGVYHYVFEKTNGRVVVETMPAKWNKATRASKCAYAWRAKQIAVRLGQTWTGIYLGELHAFNGSEIGIDDQVDATVAAYDAIMLGRVFEEWSGTFTFGSAGAAG